MILTDIDIEIIKKMIQAYPSQIKPPEGWMERMRHPDKLREYLQPRIRNAVFKSHHHRELFRSMLETLDIKKDNGKIISVGSNSVIGRLVDAEFCTITLQSLVDENEILTVNRTMEFFPGEGRINYGYAIAALFDINQFKLTKGEATLINELIGSTGDYQTILNVKQAPFDFGYRHNMKMLETTMLIIDDECWHGDVNEVVKKNMTFGDVLMLSGYGRIRNNAATFIKEKSGKK